MYVRICEVSLSGSRAFHQDMRGPAWASVLVPERLIRSMNCLTNDAKAVHHCANLSMVSTKRLPTVSRFTAPPNSLWLKLPITYLRLYPPAFLTADLSLSVTASSVMPNFPSDKMSRKVSARPPRLVKQSAGMCM